jgi:L-2-hydroxyglutarate oxidase
MKTDIFDFAIIGGGIVGLAVGMKLTERFRGASILLIEKEQNVAGHQTGHNSGVIHSGIYYKPGSLKAELARKGNRSMVEFCKSHAIKHEVSGKLIVASALDEMPGLKALYERGLQNQLDVRWLDRDRARELEPNVTCQAAVHVPSTGLVSYVDVAREYTFLLREAGAELLLNTRMVTSSSRAGIHHIETTGGHFAARFFINCAGLHSDRVVTSSGGKIQHKIVPFRGEYYDLVPEKSDIIRSMIYPVPNPNFPFLGVHLTKSVDGHVHAGPNAVLALSREGYSKTDIVLWDSLETLLYPGFWRLAIRYWKEGMAEMQRSFSKARFLTSLQKLVPSIEDNHLVPASAGVRAQALLADGSLVDDFLIIEGEQAIHVCNAPSPAATASLEIGNAVVERIAGLLERRVVWSLNSPLV